MYYHVCRTEGRFMIVYICLWASVFIKLFPFTPSKYLQHFVQNRNLNIYCVKDIAYIYIPTYSKFINKIKEALRHCTVRCGSSYIVTPIRPTLHFTIFHICRYFSSNRLILYGYWWILEVLHLCIFDVFIANLRVSDLKI